MATTVLVQSQTMPMEVDDSQHASPNQLSSQNSQESRPHTLLSYGNGSQDSSHAAQSIQLSRARAITLIATLTGITFVGSMSGGLLTVGLPEIAADLKLPDNLLLWYVITNGPIRNNTSVVYHVLKCTDYNSKLEGLFLSIRKCLLYYIPVSNQAHHLGP